MASKTTTGRRGAPGWAVAAAGLASLAGAAALQPSLIRMRESEMGDRRTAVVNGSPLVVFTTVALGGFRGLLMDVLWNRASDRQMEQDDYIEMVQLADWITKLEPRLPVIWDYHSFNMAYNISAMCSDPAERWRWVSNGIRLLRDEALAVNPRESVLYDRLCRIYRHKLVEYIDPARDYYRAAFAAEMDAALAGLAKEAGQPGGGVDAASTFRKRTGLDPAAMAAIDAELGPFDWRLPEAHVVYWAREGRKAAPGVNDRGFDGIACDAMADTFLQGSVVRFDPAGPVLQTGPRLDYLGRALEEFRSVRARHAGRDNWDNLQGSFRHFLRRAIPVLAANGRRNEAAALLSIVQDELKEKESLGLTLDQYVEYVTRAPAPPDPRDEIRQQALKHHEGCSDGCEEDHGHGH